MVEKGFRESVSTPNQGMNLGMVVPEFKATLHPMGLDSYSAVY